MRPNTRSPYLHPRSGSNHARELASETVKEPRPVGPGLLKLNASKKDLGGAPPTILLFLLIVLRRILPAGVNIPLLLLASLTGLSTLSRLLTLAVLALTRLALPLAVLATLLLIFVHIVCHIYSSVFCRAHLAAPPRYFDSHLSCLP